MLLRFRLWQLRNLLRRLSWDGIIKLVGLLLLAVFFVIFELYAAEKLFQTILQQEQLGELRILLLMKIFDMVFLIFLAMLFYSSLIMTLSHVFLAGDMGFLLTMPISITRITLIKFMQVSTGSGWMLAVFGLPFLYAYGFLQHVSIFYYLLTPAMLAPFIIIASALGMMTTIFVVRIFPAYRARHVLTVAGLFIGTGLIIIIRLMKPEQLVNPIGIELLSSYVQTMRIPTPRWLPSYWLAEIIQNLAEGRWSGVWRYGTLLAACASVMMVLLWWVSNRLLFATLSRSQVRAELPTMSPSCKKSAAVSNYPFSFPFIRKDFKLFFRDGAQWSQLLILGALVFIYIFNFKNMPFELINYQYMMSFVSLGATGLVIAAISARFAFPALSMEGVCLWLLKTTPQQPGLLIREKLFFVLLPNLLVAELLTVFSNQVLAVGVWQFWLSVVLSACLAVGITCLGVGLGFCYPRFGQDHPAEVALSTGGVMFMVTSVAFVSLIIAIAAAPDVIRFFPNLYRIRAGWGEIDRWASLVVCLIVSCVCCAVPLIKARDCLQKLEM